MYVKSQKMADVIDSIEFALPLAVRIRYQPQSMETVNNSVGCDSVCSGDRRSRLHLTYRGLLCPQYQIINVPLLLCEPSAHGNGTGNVSSVVSVFSTNIHQQQVALFHLPVVSRIMKGNGILTRTYYRPESRHRGSVPPPLIFQKGLYFKLIHSRGALCQNCLKTLAGNVNRLLQHHYLIFILVDPHL